MAETSTLLNCADTPVRYAILRMNIFTTVSRSFSNQSLRKLNFYYDVASPYSWLAFEVLIRYKKHWNVDLQLQPVLLGGIFKSTGNSSPMMASAAKAQHLAVDIKRCASYFDVPFRQMQEMADLFTKGSMAPMRFLTATKMFCPQYLEEASRSFWMVRWNKDLDFTTPEAMKSIAESCKMTEEEMNLIFEKMKSVEVKEALKKNTDYAVELGTFGLPTIVLHDRGEDHLFFGSDRFPILAHILGKEWKGPCPDKQSKL